MSSQQRITMRVTFSLILLLTIVNCALITDSKEMSAKDTSSRTETTSGLGTLKPGGTLALKKIMRLVHKLQRKMQPEDISFYLYTQLNPTKPQLLHIHDTESVTESNFNSSLPTRITIHGWMSDAEQDINNLIRDAHLSRGPHNIIVLDWIKESVHIYVDAIKHVPRIGKELSKFIEFMADNGWLKPENLTLIGHSLGAHIAGNAARSLKTGRVHTIVALDPAQSGFNYDNSQHRLRSSDAYYVESIQTTAGSLGYIQPIGKAAFYPNGGVVQPDCGLDLIKSCGHSRSYVYYGEAIRDGGFPSIQCDSYRDAIGMNCGNQFSRTVRMGDPKNAETASGVFFVPILPNPPYSYA